MLRSSWKIVVTEVGQDLYYAGDPTVVIPFSEPQKESTSEISKPTEARMGMNTAFIQLFEEYPKSREFFSQFRSTSIEEIKSNVTLLKKLQDHSVRVFQLVEKVIVRMEPSIEKVSIRSLFLNLTDSMIYSWR